MSQQSTEINIRLTIENIHKEFPNMSIEEILKILDCISITSAPRIRYPFNDNIAYYDNKLATNGIFAGAVK